MAKTRQQKQAILDTYEGYLKNAKAIYLAETSLNANESNELKKKMHPSQAKYAIIKNTLFTLATKNVLNYDLDLKGQIGAFVCTTEEVVEAAKALSDLKKDKKATYVLCLLDGQVIEINRIDALANLESKEQLLGKLMYLMNYPTVGLARALNNNIEKLLYALNAVKDKQG